MRARKFEGLKDEAAFPSMHCNLLIGEADLKMCTYDTSSVVPKTELRLRLKDAIDQEVG